MDSVEVISWCCGVLGRLSKLGQRVYQERSRRSNINLMLCCDLSLLRIQKQPRRQHAISHILIPLLLEFRCRPPLPICCARQGSVFQNDSTLWLCRGGQSGEDPTQGRRLIPGAVYRNPQPGLLLLDLETALSVSPHGSAGMSQMF
jgi:hypothetical protein